MRRDIDRLMNEQGLAGLVVLALDRYSPAMYYMTGQKIHVGLYVRASNGHAHLVVDPMERDQAAASGIDHSTLTQHGWVQRVERESKPLRAWAGLIADMLENLGIKGRVAFYGEATVGNGWELIEALRAKRPDLVIDDTHPDVLTRARQTKDDDEVANIRRSSEGIVAAWDSLVAYVRTLRRDGETVVDGMRAVKLGDLRALLHREFVARGLEGGESIVAQGRDAGVPHNRGNDEELLRPGAPVIVDIFPGEAGGGYFSDFTRTFCVGVAPEPVKRAWDDVHSAFREAMGAMRVGEPCRSLNEKVCDVFEARGHATRRTDPSLQEGYVHSLGHGVGLSIHEAPLLGGPPSNLDKLEPGMVVTVEPGLYYPSRGLGVRIEDTVVMRADGGFENLTPAAYELEILIPA
ncbi:MAG: aminopeptidase P family protein [Candidatus Eisenbacteria bacterium]|uniref:Aminopeptidase P family protein n=1 Tax=Eiseniibacteriota bacterium TaxID=2212470 RepID=A0A849SCS2_UNCEI|nr:aminopeptidase P family protein [Candidatus Eisenbacteria bacterium]